MRVILTSQAWIPKSALQPERLDKLRERLVVHPKKWGGTSAESIKLYTEGRDAIGIPRGYYTKYRTGSDVVDDRTTRGDRSVWVRQPAPFAGQLYEDQAQAQTNVLAAYRVGCLGGILRAAPGTGKTTMALSITSKLQMPVLVGVHTEFLADQWEERAAKFLPNARVGRVQGDRCDFRDKHIVVALLQSLSEREYPTAFYEYFGALIFDEVHHLGAQTWAPTPLKFNARYRLGLSATPSRKDGAASVFRWHLGDELYASSTPRLVPAIRIIHTAFSVDHVSSEALSSPGALVTAMTESVTRNATILDQLELAVAAGRKVLVLSSRVEHLRYLQSGARRFSRPPTSALYIGGMDRHQRAKAAQAQVVLATEQLVREGLDIEELDTLFITVPMSDVEQAVGRIQRPHPTKKGPLVADFRDPYVRMSMDASRYRDAYYRRLGAR